MDRRSSIAVVLALSLVAASCRSGEETFSDRYRPAAMPELTDELGADSLRQAAAASASYWSSRGPEATTKWRDPQLSERRVASSAARVARILGRSPETAAAALARRCRAYESKEPARVTAYYEPQLEARRAPDDRYRYPLYRLPDAATMAAVEQKLGRKPERSDIDGAGALDGLGLEAAWLDDPIERFFLHVQGSGRLRFEDGSEARAAYGGNNGAQYRSVGSVMLQQGMLTPRNASASAMRAWLWANPQRRDELLFLNPRYVFFTLTDGAGSEGPRGSLGVPLVAGRSVAVDPQFVPPGALLYLRSRRPVLDDSGNVSAWEPLQRFVFAHDAGAAIRGSSRLDVFWGSGARAGAEAGYMSEPGELFLLVCGGRRR